LQSLLLPTGRVFVNDPHSATEIIYCEGPTFSFKQAIRALQEGPRQAVYKLHASGSTSLVGSHSKDERGETLFFPPKA
jgi:N-acetylglucosaminyl-diphospho-decaprenol L-rhamnosyltransferase